MNNHNEPHRWEETMDLKRTVPAAPSYVLIAPCCIFDVKRVT